MKTAIIKTTIPLNVTDTFFTSDGELACVTRPLKPGDKYVYGEYCTGPLKDDDQEYGFPIETVH